MHITSIREVSGSDLEQDTGCFDGNIVVFLEISWFTEQLE
jgi:hypothetical protein